MQTFKYANFRELLALQESFVDRPAPDCLRSFARDPQSEDEAGADQDNNDHKEPTSTGPTRLGGESMSRAAGLRDLLMHRWCAGRLFIRAKWRRRQIGPRQRIAAASYVDLAAQ